mgnify:CR=1 FL=1
MIFSKGWVLQKAEFYRGTGLQASKIVLVSNTSLSTDDKLFLILLWRIRIFAYVTSLIYHQTKGYGFDVT